MNLVELTHYATNEEKAEEYLREQGILSKNSGNARIAMDQE